MSVLASVHKLDNSIKSVENKTITAMQDFESRLVRAVHRNRTDTIDSESDLSELLVDYRVFKKETLDCISDMKNVIKRLSYDIDDQQAYTRKNCLLLHGLPEEREENVVVTVLSFLNSNLKVPYFKFTEDMLDNCHRLGPYKGNSKRSRPVIVKFLSYLVRKRVWLNKKHLKGTNFLITESLTSMRSKVYQRARAAAGGRNVWTLDNRIYILMPSGKKKVITNDDELDVAIPLLKVRKNADGGSLSADVAVDCGKVVSDSVEVEKVQSESSDPDREVKPRKNYNTRPKVTTKGG